MSNVPRIEKWPEMPDIHKADSGKAQLTLVPRKIIWAIAMVRMYGVNVKYPETGRDGWKTISKERIQDAMYRHMLKYLENPDGVDEESGLPHLWHLATNVAFLCEMEEIHDGISEQSLHRPAGLRRL